MSIPTGCVTSASVSIARTGSIKTAASGTTPPRGHVNGKPFLRCTCVDKIQTTRFFFYPRQARPPGPETPFQAPALRRRRDDRAGAGARRPAKKRDHSRRARKANGGARNSPGIFQKSERGEKKHPSLFPFRGIPRDTRCPGPGKGDRTRRARRVRRAVRKPTPGRLSPAYGPSRERWPSVPGRVRSRRTDRLGWPVSPARPGAGFVPDHESEASSPCECCWWRTTRICGR